MRVGAVPQPPHPSDNPFLVGRGGDDRTEFVLGVDRIPERVLQNLVDNALRHTPSGGAVTLSLEPRDGRVEVSVRDTGTGIALADLPHVFERYWRGESEAAAATLAPGSSSGLGLAIVKRILDLHGSVVQVRSAPREGACFVFGLPVAA